MDIIQFLPKDISLSPDLKDRARYFFVIQHLGIKYYIPATFELIKFLKAMGVTIKKCDNGYLIEPYKKAAYAETFFRDFIAAIHLQIRDTVGSEVYNTLSQEIHNGLEKMFQKRLSEDISKSLENAAQKRIEVKHAQS
jgi:hypothetical protein